MTNTLSATLTSTVFNQDVFERAIASAFPPGQCAQRVAEGFAQYNTRFCTAARQAPLRFQQRDWQGSQLDMFEYTKLYDSFVDRTSADIESMFGEPIRCLSFWEQAKHHFSSLVEELPDNELCKAFFNSTVQRFFTTAGSPPSCEFKSQDLTRTARTTDGIATRRLIGTGPTYSIAMQLCQSLPTEAEWHDLNASAEQLAEKLDSLPLHHTGPLTSIEVLDTVFYRFTRAYIVGRVIAQDRSAPFALELINTEAGMVIDNMMLNDTAVNDLFRFKGVCFFVELDRVIDTITYLKSLVPKRSTSELLTLIGRKSVADNNGIANGC